MGAGCEAVGTRPNLLGIAQDASCVTWGQLTDLRISYNRMWNALNICGVSSGDKYGRFPHFEEITPLPTIEGFFRLTISAGGDPISGYSCNVSLVEFILTGGTLLTLVDNPSYSYITGAKKPFDAVMKDDCTSCSKFHFTSHTNAGETWECGGGTQNPYSGYKKLTFIATDQESCGQIHDWGANKSILEDHMNSFVCWKKVEAPGDSDCNEVADSCCSSMSDIGRYEKVGEDDGKDVLVLKYVDVFVNGGGGSVMTGELRPLIWLDELEDIKSRVVNDIPLFRITEHRLCDRCGPDINLFNCEELLEGVPQNPDKKGFKCLASSLDWTKVAKSYIASGTECAECDNPFEEGHICTCPWTEIANVMKFINIHCCVMACTETCICEPIVGCMDNVSGHATNYDPEAEEMGTCVCDPGYHPASSDDAFYAGAPYNDVGCGAIDFCCCNWGCTVVDAVNHSSSAFCDDGSCYGCYTLDPVDGNCYGL